MTVTLSPDIQAEMAEAIADAGGAEVFFAACVDEKARVTGVEVLARGDAEEVPAVLSALDLWDMVIHNHPGGDLTPSKADLSVAAGIAQSGKGFAIVDNSAQSLYVVVEPRLPEPRVRIETEEVERFFAPEGPLAAHIQGFESRPGQTAMALSVLASLNDEHVLAVEAGTGSGKSFAYLVPAILYAKANRIRVVVATGTINLQEQLAGKDLPLLARAFSDHYGGQKDAPPFRFSLMKGRSNYVCLRRVRALAVEPQLLPCFADDDQDIQGLKAIIEWSEHTRDGSLSDLPFQPRGSVWEEVSSDSDSCLGMQCAEFQRCFYFRARAAAAQSTVLVVNHHLFFADLTIRQETGRFNQTFVLPPWRQVIFDEAHGLEDAASAFFGVHLTQRGGLYRLGRLQSAKKRDKGILPRLSMQLMKSGETTLAGMLQGELQQALRQTRKALLHFFDYVSVRITTALQEQGGRATSLRYTGDDALWGGIFEACIDTAAQVRQLRLAVQAVQRPLSQQAETAEKLKAAAVELGGVVRRLEVLERDLGFFADKNEPDHVRWIALNNFRGQQQAALKTAPFLVGKTLAEALWQTVPTCVLTSATLSVDNKIDFLADRLGLGGLPDQRFRFAQVSSPFQWDRQALFMVPNDGAGVDTPAYQEELGGWLLPVVQTVQGGCFVLFTSYGMLKNIYESTRVHLEALGIESLRQGEAPRQKLLDRFQQNGRAVLFGTESFWQGVDVRGDALSCVIIAKLPFAVPTEPLQMARMEEVRSRGRNPFRDFSLPQAVLKLRQGAGRLIRSTRDRGVVVVFDKRIIHKPYGRSFVHSLPPFDRVIDTRANLLARMQDFFQHEAGNFTTKDTSRQAKPGVSGLMEP